MKKYDHTILKGTQEKMRKIASNLLLPFENTIVELGCSTGNFARILYNRNVPNYIGIDIQQDKLDLAEEEMPDYDFRKIDIVKNKDILKLADAFVSFQSLEHIGSKDGNEDIEVLSQLKPNTKVIFSVPNSPYRTEHKRWFEIKGWKARYIELIYFDFEMTIQNVNKEGKRSFLFRGYRK